MYEKNILNLINGNLNAVANMVFKLPEIWDFLRNALQRTVANEFKVYCGDSAESILKATSPSDIASFSNGVFLHEVELWCPFWMSCLQGACCNNAGKLIPQSTIKETKVNSILGDCCPMSQIKNVSRCLSFIQDCFSWWN